MKRRLLAVLALACIIFTSCTKQGIPAQEQVSEPKSLAAAKEFRLESLDGDTVTLSDLKGKTVVINFLTTWCGYCVKELPGFLKLKEMYKDEDVTFLFIDVRESRDEVEKDRSAKGYDNYDPLLDLNGSVSAAYGVSGYPTTFVINSDGQIYETYWGMVDDTTIKSAIEELLSR